MQRGQQVTVVTRASLPDGWTRFDLRRSPTVTPSPVSFEQLIQPRGTTYTFTVTDDEAGASVITYDLVAARPNPVRPGQRTQLGDVVVTTEFLVPMLRYNTPRHHRRSHGAWELRLPLDRWRHDEWR